MARPRKSESKPPPMLEPLNQWVVDALRESRMSNTDLAKALGIDQSRVAEMKVGKRKVQATEIPIIARETGLPPPAEFMADVEGQPAMVPVVGYVGAGAEMHLYAFADSPDEFVPMPENGNKNTVAVEIRGSSLGSIFDTWLVYYDQIHTPPTPEMMNKLCVVGLADDRVLIKRLRKGSSRGLYNLESTTEGLIEDVAIIWAAKVKNMSPR